MNKLMLLVTLLFVSVHGSWSFWGEQESKPQDPFKRLSDKFEQLTSDIWDTHRDVWKAHRLTGNEPSTKDKLMEKLDHMRSDFWSAFDSLPSWPKAVGEAENLSESTKIFLQSSVQRGDLAIDFVHRNGKDFLDIQAPDFKGVDDLKLLNEMRRSVGLAEVKKTENATIRHFAKPTASKYMTRTDCKEGYCVTYMFSNGQEKLRLMGEVPESFDRQAVLQEYRDYFAIAPEEILPAVEGPKTEENLEEGKKKGKTSQNKPVREDVMAVPTEAKGKKET